MISMPEARKHIPWLVPCCMLFLVGFAMGQQQHSAEQKKTSGKERNSAQQTAPRSPHPGLRQELAEASKEAAGEDKNATFKRSASVVFISRITGLSLESAYWAAVLLNFVIIAGLIVMLSRMHLPAMFRSRSESIQKNIEEARRASEAANRRLSDIEGRLGRLDAEIGAMRATAEAEARAEEERLRAAAEEDKRKIVEAAEREIAAAAKLARRELKAYAAELAVSLAEKRIRVDADADYALVRSFVDQLGKDGL